MDEFSISISGFALSAYQSGFEHGVSDGRQPDPTQRYILQPGKGFNDHSGESTEPYQIDRCCMEMF
jgi:hypothetical protein